MFEYLTEHFYTIMAVIFILVILYYMAKKIGMESYSSESKMYGVPTNMYKKKKNQLKNLDM